MSIGFGIAYPIGVIGVCAVRAIAAAIAANRYGGSGRRATKSYRRPTSNRSISGADFQSCCVWQESPSNPGVDRLSGQITRVQQGDQLVPIGPEHVFAEGQTILLVTDSDTADVLTMMLGVPTQANVVTMRIAIVRKWL